MGASNPTFLDVKHWRGSWSKKSLDTSLSAIRFQRRIPEVQNGRREPRTKA